VKKRIRLQGSLMFIALAAMCVFYKALVPQRHNNAAEAALAIASSVSIAAGFLFRIASRGYKSENSDNSFALVTGGPYSLSRNPMYFGTFLIGLGISLAIFSWWVWVIFCFIYLAIYIPQIRKEEDLLLGRFKGEYERYCVSSPRFFPDITKMTRANISFKQRWVLPELPSLLIVVFVITAVNAFRGIAWSGLMLILFTVIATGLFYEKENIPKKSQDNTK